MVGPATSGFVGRQGELATFERAVEEARDGVPSVLLVGGDAGIGKTTLTAEAARRCGIDLYLGRCLPIGGEVIPLGPLVDLLRQVRRQAPAGVTESDAFSVLAPWLQAHSDASTAPTGAGNVFAPVLDLLVLLAGDDAVMVGIEDLHWADAGTWDLFEFLARNLVDERIVLVGTHRANETASNPAHLRRLAELGRLPSARRIHLGGLVRADIEARVRAILDAPPDRDLVDEILDRGQGNPFFTEELVAAHLAGDAIPPVLSDLITADVADLEDETRLVVGALATIGGTADHDLLRSTVELDAPSLDRSLRDAIARQLVVVDDDTDAYRFRHPLICEVVYRDLLPSERTRLHARVADALRAQPASTRARADSAGALALHLDRAGDRASAFTALLAAADAAETIAPAAALHHLERAFELWDDAGDAAAHERRGDRLWQAAELATGTAGNQRAVELARAASAFDPPPRGDAWAHERLGRYLWASGHLDESAIEFEYAAAILATDELGPGAAPVFAGLAQADLMAGRYESAEQRCRQVFALVPAAADDPAAWGMARRVLGGVRSVFGEPDQGVDLAREAVAAADTVHARALAILYLSLALLDAGRYDEAITAALDGVADGLLTGVDHSFGGYMDSLAAEGLIRLGRWAEADTVLARHVEPEALAVGAIRLGRVRAILAARRGDSDGARHALAQAEAQPFDPFHRAFFDSASSEVHLVLRDWDRARAAAESGWDRTPRAARLWRARFAMHLANATVEQVLHAQAAREEVDVDAAVAVLEERIAVAEADTSATDRRSDAAAHLAHARAAVTRLTKPDPDAWSDAAREWKRLADPWQLAMVRLHEADAAASTGDAARASDALRDAQSIASELGAPPLLDDIAAVARRTRIDVEAPIPVALDVPSIDRLGLTPREAEVLSQVAAGHTNRQIGDALYISEKTASVHVSNILRKLGVTSRVDAAAIAQRLGAA